MLLDPFCNFGALHVAWTDSGATYICGCRESCELLQRDGTRVTGEPATTPAAGATPADRPADV